MSSHYLWYYIGMANEQTEFKDVNLICKECGNAFLFTAKEQRFYVKQGFEHVPTRCNDCRLAARERRDRGQEYVAIKCKITGKVGRIPFTPDDPDDAYTAEAFETEFAAKGRFVDPLQEPDHTDLIEKQRAERLAANPQPTEEAISGEPQPVPQPVSQPPAETLEP